MQKILDKIQHPIMIKTLSKLRIEGNFPNLILKKKLQKVYISYHPQWRETQRFPSKINKSPLTTPFQYYNRSPSQCKRQEKDWEKVIKQSLFTDDMIVYVANLKELTKNWKRQKYHDDKKHLSFHLILRNSPTKWGLNIPILWVGKMGQEMHPPSGHTDSKQWAEVWTLVCPRPPSSSNEGIIPRGVNCEQTLSR